MSHIKRDCFRKLYFLVRRICASGWGGTLWRPVRLLWLRVVVGEGWWNCTAVDTVVYKSVECGGNCHACLFGGTEASHNKHRSWQPESQLRFELHIAAPCRSIVIRSGSGLLSWRWLTCLIILAAAWHMIHTVEQCNKVIMWMIYRGETVRRIDQSTSVINFMGCARHVGPNGRTSCFLVVDAVRPLRIEVFFFVVGDQDLETDLYGSRGTGFSHTLPFFTKIKSNKSSNTTYIYRGAERLHVVFDGRQFLS